MLTFGWVATCVTSFLLIIFVKYLPGDTFMTGMAMGFSCLGYLTSDMVSARYGVFKNLILCYISCAILIAAILAINM